MAAPLSTALVPATTVLPELAKTGLSIVMVYTTHYTSTKLYNLVCVPSGITGYFFGFLTTASPWCRLLLELMKLTENQYSTVILIVFSRILLKAMGV
jgi:hypothetical protein